MGNMFGKPKVVERQAEAKAPDPTPLPIRDDEAERREKRKVFARIAGQTGDASTRLARMGDTDPATTRTGTSGQIASSILGAR